MLEPSTRAAGHLDVEDLAFRHRAGLVRYFQRRTRRVDTAEDFAQETFMRLARVERLGVVDNPVAYMFRVASSVLKDGARRSRTQIVEAAGLDPGLHADEAPCAERMVAARDRLFLIKRVLDELPAKTREIFLLNRLDGLSYPQLAVRFGVSTSAIEKHMMKAIAHLHRRIADWETLAP